jgi:hypothetical protein
VNSRAASILIVICLWAALYLPLLGSLEIRGEEGKRVMPAVQMLERGNYAPYLFYVRAPVFYCSALEELPANARFLLIQSRDLSKMETRARWNALQPKLLAHTNFFRSHDTMLFSVVANQPNP